MSAISASAAILAAALSGFTLYLSGRRETRKWLRESLLDALAAYLDASFARRAGRTYDARVAVGAEPIDLQPFREFSEAGKQRQRDALTRLRLLAPAALVKAAEDLLYADEQVAREVLDPMHYPTPDRWAELLTIRASAREAMQKEARRALGLDAGAPIRSRRFEKAGSADGHLGQAR